MLFMIAMNVLNLCSGIYAHSLKHLFGFVKVSNKKVSVALIFLDQTCLQLFGVFLVANMQAQHQCFG
jgi:hypothetical protein